MAYDAIANIIFGEYAHPNSKDSPKYNELIANWFSANEACHE